MRVVTHFIAPNLPRPPRKPPQQSRRPRAVVVDGMTFGSLSEAAKHFGVKRQTVHWWLNRKKNPRGYYENVGAPS